MVVRQIKAERDQMFPPVNAVTFQKDYSVVYFWSQIDVRSSTLPCSSSAGVQCALFSTHHCTLSTYDARSREDGGAAGPRGSVLIAVVDIADGGIILMVDEARPRRR